MIEELAMTTTQLYNKLAMLPESLKKEVVDFIDFLISKSPKKPNSNTPKFGSAKGFYEMADDFDEPFTTLFPESSLGMQ